MEIRKLDFHSNTPWAACKEDLETFTKVLKKLSKKAPSNEMGSRFVRLFTPGKKARTHHFFVLASSYGMLLNCCYHVLVIDLTFQLFFNC